MLKSYVQYRSCSIGIDVVFLCIHTCLKINQQSILFSQFKVTPLTALKFAELVVKAGFPPGVINILPGPGERETERERDRSSQLDSLDELCL